MSEVVVIGGGQSASQCLVSLRASDYKESITIIAEEDHIPYQRPPLSKDYLFGKVGLERVHTKNRDFYKNNEIELILNKTVQNINRGKKALKLNDGNIVNYGKLVIATGSRVRKLYVEGSELSNIDYLRNIKDADNIRSLIQNKKNLVIVGAGYIGLEVAAVANQLGVKVSIIEMADRVMNRTVDPLISEYYQNLHTQNGVKIFLNSALESFGGKGSVSKVYCTNQEIDTDFVVVGAGILPNQELASEAGLKCENGIWVDEYCQTEDSDIYACGDCTNHPNKILQTRLRLESVHNAIEQGKTVASSILGEKNSYNQVPWFWSDQYDHKLQIVGISGDHDRTVKREAEDGKSFLLFYLKEDSLIAVDAVNNPKDFMVCKKLVANRTKISSDNLLDASADLNELLL